ncbi:uncharacterized protein LOC127866088 [Dreissena polymorpha]|uniref:Uncharacterized protein n=1 Tax=Dreissena polymorpha TaxID=45954 RepID=A0A9D4RBA5_DREPO|nr:uncharacterized protein LOC127866088 [Dreissena polymorpha]KAH3861899.1 hypothetical protein DPMN_024853 [Dreissena polymorpha]
MTTKRDFAKSAPVRRLSRQAQGKKNNSVKEIQQWIAKDGGGDQTMRGARNVSQLTENVTEERMLYARKLELGRERSKFLSLHEYEKQKFVERQSTKDKMMKKYMDSARKVIEKAHSRRTLTVHIPQVEYYSLTSTPVGDENTPRLESPVSAKYNISSNRRMKSCPQLRSNPRIHTAKSNTEATRGVVSSQGEAFSVPVNDSLKSVSLYSVDGPSRPSSTLTKHAVNATNSLTKIALTNRACYVNTSHGTNEENLRVSAKADVGRLPLTPSGRPKTIINDIGQAGTLQRGQRSSSPTKSVKLLSVREDTKPTLTAPGTPQQSRDANTMERASSSVTDPRYLALETTLIPAVPLKKKPPPVVDIIAKNAVLKMRSKCESAASAKQMHTKFIALLLEKELGYR